MEKNVVSTERIARLVVGAVFAIAAGAIYFEFLTVAGMLGAGLIVVGALLGVVLLVTGAVGYCPINAMLGRGTVGAEDTEHTMETDSPPESEVGRAH